MKFYIPGIIIAFGLIIQNSNGEPQGCERGEPQFSAPSDTVKPMPPAFLEKKTTTTLSVVLHSDRKGGRARQLAILIRNFTPEQIDHGIVVVFQPYPVTIQALPLKTNVRRRSKHTVLIPTGKHICEVEWARYSIEQIRSTFYVAQLTVQGKVVAAGSLSEHLSWMGANIQLIASLRLADLAIPGTVNSALYTPYGTKDPSKSEELDRSFSQEEDIFTQLVYGVRAFEIELTAIVIPSMNYFDFRIKGQKETNTSSKLGNILVQIRRFLLAFREEVVFIDLRLENATLPGLNHLRHVVSEIMDELLYVRGDRKLDDIMQQFLGQVVQENRRAIVTFPKHEHMPDLLPEIRHVRVNTSSLIDLKNQFSRALPKYKRTGGWFYNARIQLQPSLSRHETRRELATQLNFRAADWCHVEPTFKDNLNIISTEYFANSDIVSCCIALNIQRAEALHK